METVLGEMNHTTLIFLMGFLLEQQFGSLRICRYSMEGIKKCWVVMRNNGSIIYVATLNLTILDKEMLSFILSYICNV